MKENDSKTLFSVLDWVRYAVSNFQKEKVHLGQGCANFLDEALYLLSGFLHLDFSEMDYFLNAHLTEDEKKLFSKFVDPLAMFYISNMIFRVEHGLADSRDYQSKLAVLEINATLHSEGYLKEVWHVDDDSDSNSDDEEF